jgi:hypothetical protein
MNRTCHEFSVVLKDEMSFRDLLARRIRTAELRERNARKTKDFQIRAFDGELCQMADIPLAVKPMRAIATSGTQPPKPPPPRGPARVEKCWSP